MAVADENVFNGSTSKEISHGIVAIYKEYLGRGPTTARTTIADDHVVTILDDSLTKAEHTLVQSGEQDTVRGMRRRFQMAMSEDITRLVEAVTGRKGRVMLSDHNVERDIAIEMVVLEPDGE
jgi:uncharacterized protein YbcI